MSEWFLVLAAAPFACLMIPAVVQLGLAAVFVGSRDRIPGAHEPVDGVTVLIPARDEGERAVAAVRSLLAQDHRGLVRVLLLVRDADDTAVKPLVAAFGSHWLDDERGPVRRLVDEPDRVAAICFTGEDPKHAKVNWGVARVDTDLLAILDCDHEARSDWLRSAVAVAETSGAAIVQGRREPAAIASVFGFWDSLHQHVGCEVTNLAYDRLGLGVFFSGTTALIRAAALRERPLQSCLTEDTDLSYAATARGWRIAYDSGSGSREDVSPDLYSFLARRRRWAHGHTATFLRHLVPVLRARIGVARKLQFLVHGLHYAAVIPIAALHLLLGLYYAAGLPVVALGAASIASLAPSWAVLRSQPPRGAGVGVLALAVIGGWVWPAMILATNALVALLGGDPGLAGLPIPGPLLLAGALAYALPALTLLLGLLRLGQATPFNAALLVLTYPVMLYLDVAGVLLGLVDWAVGGAIWHRIARTSQSAGAGLRSLGPVTLVRSLVSDTGGAMRLRPWLVVGAAVLVLGGGAWLAVQPERLPVAARDCSLLEFDGHPWIVSPDQEAGYCAPQDARWGTRTGSLGSPERSTDLTGSDWEVLEDTFPCNLAVFRTDNVETLPSGGIRLTVSEGGDGDRDYSAGSVASASVEHLYGRYEVELKAARGEGLVTAFFLYRFDPWQEIDVEFLGRDTTKLLANVFYNPGVEGDLYNYGFHGTPALIDLGFDAADDFHTYALEWDPAEIRWFVDGVLVHTRSAGTPTPIPHLPMRFHVNAWPICSEVMAGAVDRSRLPATAEIRSVAFHSWSPPLVGPYRETLDASWRTEATWMQPPL